MEQKSGCVPVGSEVVGGNEDLLTEILVRLPPKSLLRFKSVSKPWLRLISSSQFRRRSSRRLCKDTSGLLLMRFSTRDCEFIPLDKNAGRNSPLERLDFVEGELDVISHCNGLLLCSAMHMIGFDRPEYYVFNPTTKEYATVSVDRVFKFGEIEAKLHDVNLAFDPRKSLHYKLLFMYRSGSTFHLQVYSSDTGVMKQFDVPFTSQDRRERFSDGVYWNGAVNWFKWKKGLYFNVDEERFGNLPMPPMPEDWPWLEYFGESNDHLHLILNYTNSRFLDIYEMDKGYSGWFPRFRVNPQSIFGSLPQSFRSLEFPINVFQLGCFRVMGVCRKDDDKASSLVFTTPAMGIVFRHHFEDESATIMSETVEQHWYVWKGSIPFIESLYRP